MTEEIEIHDSVRVYVDKLDEAPNDADLEIAEDSEQGEFYYDVSIDELGERVGKRYIRYDGPDGIGFFDTARGLLKIRPQQDQPSNRDNSIRSELMKRADELLEKYKIYVSEAETYAEAVEMAPDHVDVQVSDSGAFFYEKLPGGGADGDRQLETGDYNVDTDFGMIVADKVINDDISGIPVDDLNDYLHEVNDPELIKDALQAEIDGPGRKTGQQFIEKRARALDIDLDSFYKDESPDETTINTGSLKDQDVNISEYADSVISPELSGSTNKPWTMQEVWDEYIEPDRNLPYASGNINEPNTMHIVDHIVQNVDNPAIVYQFADNAVGQQRKQLEEHLQDLGYNFDVESVDSEYRFDLDSYQKYVTEEERLELYDVGDEVYLDDMFGGYIKGTVSTNNEEAISVEDNSGTVRLISADMIYTDEYAFAAGFETANFGDGSFTRFNPPTDLINRIEDKKLLQDSLKWDDYVMTSMFSQVQEDIEKQIIETDGVASTDYDISDEGAKVLDSSSWPGWGAVTSNVGQDDIDSLRNISSNVTTSDLEQYRAYCDESGFEDRTKLIDGLLYYREDSDVEIEDVFEYEQVAHGNYNGVTPLVEEKIYNGADKTMSNLNSETGALLVGHIKRFELQKPPDGSNWGGQSQSGGRIMAIDTPADVQQTVSHEMGHAFHRILGVSNDGYSSIDNRKESNVEDWQFGSERPTNNNPISEEFYDDVKQQWEAYKETYQGISNDAYELRPYQKRHGVELMAVGFAYWNMDPHKVRNRHPKLAEVFDRYCGKGVAQPIQPDEVEKDRYYTAAIKGRGRKDVLIQDVYEDSTDVQQYDLKFVSGRMEGLSRTVTSEEVIFEEKGDEYIPPSTKHGSRYTIQTNGEQEDIFIDQKGSTLGGDFVVRDENGNYKNSWTLKQLENAIVDSHGQGDIPWSPDQAEEDGLVEINGEELDIRAIDHWDDEIEFQDANGNIQEYSFDELRSMMKGDDFVLNPIDNVTEWEELTTGERYLFIDDLDSNNGYPGVVVGATENEVEIDQGRSGKATIDRKDIEEIRRKASESANSEIGE